VKPLLAWTVAELEAWCAANGGRTFHGRVVRREVLERGVLDYGAMTSLPTELREALDACIPLLAGREVDRRVSADGTTKLLIEFPGDPTVTVETVHIPPPRRGSNKGATLCVSSQAGCPVACPFCASGLDGLARNLEAHEIVEQYLRGQAVGPLGRSVVMGIGEPLLNHEAVSEALTVVAEELGLGKRKVTVSTVGFPDRVRRAARENPRYQLAISLHTPDQAQRDELVPAMAGVPIDEVLAAGDDWFEVTGREVTYEYVLLGGLNDSIDHAGRLAQLLVRRRATVNLIPYNPTPGLPFARPASGVPEAFAERLGEAGIVATVRWSRGLDEDAACGQLRLQHGWA
jgi:23S rRNA (adenine2503-C2)-methyltransferase